MACSALALETKCKTTIFFRCAFFLSGLSLLFLLCAVKVTVQAAESQALQTAISMKMRWVPSSTVWSCHGTAGGWSAASQFPKQLLSANTSVLCGGTYSISLTSSNFYHLATLFEKVQVHTPLQACSLIWKHWQWKINSVTQTKDHD